jgi:hypothetical protein
MKLIFRISEDGSEIITSLAMYTFLIFSLMSFRMFSKQTYAVWFDLKISKEHFPR